MKDIIIEWIVNYIKSVYDKVMETPQKNIPIMILPILLIPPFFQYLYSTFGVITGTSYLFACFRGITKIIDDPNRIVVWGMGHAIGAVAIGLIFTNLIPIFKGFDFVSIFSVIVIGYVILSLYLQARRLKNT